MSVESVSVVLWQVSTNNILLLTAHYWLFTILVPEFKPRFWLQRRLAWSIGLAMLSLVTACSPGDRIDIPTSLNSRYIDEQPALSGNGHFLAFVSNRDGRHHVWLYDLQQQRLISLPRLNRPDTVAESPSLSYTGRYITYITSEQGKPILILYDRATQQPQILNQWYQGWVRNSSISPDGRYVVFESSSRGQWDIEVLDRGPKIELDLPDGAPAGR